MAEETDGIEEAFEGQMRVLITAAGQAGERIARAREESLRRSQAASEQEARELTSRLAAEQRAARAELAGVYRSEWWDRATPEEVGRTYEVARAWSREDPEAARAVDRMRDELRTRYDVDVERSGVDPVIVQAAMQRAERDHAQGEAERSRAVAENAEALRLLEHAAQEEERAERARAAAEHEADPAERARALAEAEQREAIVASAQADSQPLYDSAERRSATASDLETRGIERDVIATRVRADVSQAKPATEAVRAGVGGRSRTARRLTTRKQAEVSR